MRIIQVAALCLENFRDHQHTVYVYIVSAAAYVADIKETLLKETLIDADVPLVGNAKFAGAAGHLSALVLLHGASFPTF